MILTAVCVEDIGREWDRPMLLLRVPEVCAIVTAFQLR
jgi:hypothetical protein